MSAQLIDGNALARQVRERVAHRVQALRARGVQPHLTVILVGEDPASQVYVRNKVADSEQTGLTATLERYPAEMSEAALLARLAALNADAGVPLAEATAQGLAGDEAIMAAFEANRRDLARLGGN